MKLNDLPTMDFHFFERPNKVTICDSGYNNILTAEVDEEFEGDFVLDSLSFDMLKRLKTNRYIHVTIASVVIKADEGKYKCCLMEKVKPDLHLDDIVYTNTYYVNELKTACKFVSNNSAQLILNGVLFNDKGSIYATDSFKFYYSHHVSEYNNMFSVPTSFINLLPNGNVNLSFTNNKVVYKGEYNLYSSLYAGNVPHIERIIDGYTPIGEMIFDVKEEFNYFNGGVMYIKDNKFIFGDEDNNFEIECATPSNANLKLETKIFLQGISLFNSIDLTYNERMCNLNGCVMLCLMS